MRFLFFLRTAAFLAISGLFLGPPGWTLLSRENTYSPKTADEMEALTVVVAVEMGANNLKVDDFICLSVDGLRPSSQFVESLRQRNMNVCSSGEQGEKSNGRNIELRLEDVKFDMPENITVRSKVFALRANEKAPEKVTLLEDGEYVLERVGNGHWWIHKYINYSQSNIATAGAGWFADDCTGTSFYIDKIEGAPGGRISLRLQTDRIDSWSSAVGLGWIGWAIKLTGKHCARTGECTDATQTKLLLDHATKDTNRLSGQYAIEVGDQHFQGAFTLDYRPHPGVYICE